MSERPDDLAEMRLALTRARRAGEDFETAWQMAIGCLARRATGGMADRVDRDRTLTALESTQIDWQLAYERKPPRPAPYPNMPLLDATDLDPALEVVPLPRRRRVAV